MKGLRNAVPALWTRFDNIAGIPRFPMPWIGLDDIVPSGMERDLGNRIRKARRLAAMTQAELAARLGVSRSAVANWESATGIWPASARLLAIAVRTGVSYEWLATGRGVSDEPDDVVAIAGELVDDPQELRLLRAFRGCRAHIRRALVDMAETQRHRR